MSNLKIIFQKYFLHLFGVRDGSWSVDDHLTRGGASCVRLSSCAGVSPGPGTGVQASLR